MKYIYHIGLISLFVILLVSCNNELEKINENPNATETPQAAYLLSAVEYHGANMYWGTSADYNSTLLWIQHWAKIQYTEADCYDVANSDFEETWNTCYSSLLTDLSAIGKTSDTNDSYKGVAEILKSWVFLQLTNLYGDIPYKDYAKSVTPAYDTQETVLRGLLQDLGNADSLLSTSGKAIEGDLMYNNNISKWKKLANSLRLRIALEIADRDEAGAKTIISSLYANKANLISSNGDIAQFVFSASPQWNPWADAFSARDDQRVSKTLVDKLKSYNDPRLKIFAQLPQDSTVTTYVGAANGLSASAANNQGFYKVSRPGSYFLEDKSPAVFFTYAEVLFDFAEAASRGWINADAETLYNSAISASMEQYGVSDDEIKHYLEQDAVKFDAGKWYESIGWQKWIAYYGQGIDAFTDWRRLGYPDLKPGPHSALPSGEMPRRFFYPDTEQSLNGNNYQSAVKQQGEDKLTTRLWFDVKDKKR